MATTNGWGAELNEEDKKLGAKYSLFLIHLDNDSDCSQLL